VGWLETLVHCTIFTGKVGVSTPVCPLHILYLSFTYHCSLSNTTGTTTQSWQHISHPVPTTTTTHSPFYASHTTWRHHLRSTTILFREDFLVRTVWGQSIPRITRKCSRVAAETTSTTSTRNLWIILHIIYGFSDKWRVSGFLYLYCRQAINSWARL
jgi:hypothetical protein